MIRIIRGSMFAVSNLTSLLEILFTTLLSRFSSVASSRSLFLSYHGAVTWLQRVRWTPYFQRSHRKQSYLHDPNLLQLMFCCGSSTKTPSSDFNFVTAAFKRRTSVSRLGMYKSFSSSSRVVVSSFDNGCFV